MGTNTAHETLIVDTKDFITTVRFNRPQRRNAMNPVMHAEMVDVLTHLATADDTRVLVLTGEGNSFCAGQDLKEFFYDLDEDRLGRHRAASDAQLWRGTLLRLFPKPTIAAVNGFCFGGAFTIVGNCDIAIAGAEATFGLSEVNFGKIAGGHVSKVLHENLHPRDAMYYLLTGKTFDAEEASRIRLVTRTVPQGELMATVTELATELAQKNPDVVRLSKEAYKYMRDMNWEEAEAWLQAKSRELDAITDKTWRKGVEQFNAGQYRPSSGQYDWQS